MLRELMEATSPAESVSARWRGSPLPEPIERDREVLAWLQCSPELGGEVTGYVCGVLTDWCLQGRPYPQEPASLPVPAGEHLQLLRDVVDRLSDQARTVPGAAGTFELSRAVRLLRRALRAVEDPEGVRAEIGRELLGMPSITGRRLLPPEGLTPCGDGWPPA